MVSKGLKMKIGPKNPLLFWEGHPLCCLDDLYHFADSHMCLKKLLETRVT